MAGEFGGKLTAEQSERYRRAKLIMLTGWTTQQIDNAGAQDCSDVLQLYEAEMKAK